MYALIGGSGFEGNDVIRVTEEVEMTTPYGGALGADRLRDAGRRGDRLFAPPRRSA